MDKVEKLRQNILHGDSPSASLDELIGLTVATTIYNARKRWVCRTIIIILVTILSIACSLVCYHMMGLDLTARCLETGRAFGVSFGIGAFTAFVTSLMRR